MVDVKTQPAILIANKNHDEVQAEIGILLVQALERSVNTKRYGRIAHPRNYKGGKRQTLGEFCSCRLGLEFGGFGEAQLALGKRDGEDLFHFGFLAVAGHSQFADQEIAGALEHFLFAE